MSNTPQKMYKYKQNNAILTIGLDMYGRLFSSIEKGSQIIAQDMFMRMPSEIKLKNLGWTRYYE